MPKKVLPLILWDYVLCGAKNYSSSQDFTEYNLIEALKHSVLNDDGMVNPLLAPGEVRNPRLREIG